MKNFGSLTTHLLNGVHLWSVDVVWSLKSARTIVGDIERKVLEKKKEDDYVWEKKRNWENEQALQRFFSLSFSLSLSLHQREAF